MGAAADLGRGPALRGPQGRALLPALRHRALAPRGGARLPRRRRPVDLRALPGHASRRGPLAGRRRAAGLDDDALDAGLERRRRDRPGADLRARAARRRGLRAGREPRRARCSARTPRCSTASPGARSRAPRYEPPFPFIPRRGLRRARPHRAAGRLRQRRRRHRARAHRDRVRRGRLPPRRAVRPGRRQPGAAGRHLRRAHRPLRRALREGRRPGPDRRPRARGPLSAAPRSTSTPIRTAGAATRRCSTTRRRAGTSARRRGATSCCAANEADRVVPVPHQARALRQVAREQRRLGAVARALLGHAAAGLALRAGPRPLRRLARRAARAGRRPSPEDLHRPYIDEVTFAVPRVRRARWRACRR